MIINNNFVSIIILIFIVSFTSTYSFQNVKVINNNRYITTTTKKSKLLMSTKQVVTYYEELSVPSKYGISFEDLTPGIKDAISKSGCLEGVVTVLSRHTTCAITINELEPRLIDDARQFLLKLVPPAYPYLHNDLHLRNGPPGWPCGDEAWRKQEPINCHSHLIAMLLGTSESIPIHKGELKIGNWQSIIMAELDGPRTRTIGVQITGTK